MRFIRHILVRLAALWRAIWFTPSATTPLELTRIGLAAALLAHYGFATPYLLSFWGDNGWMPRKLLAEEVDDPLYQSLFFYFHADWQLVAFHWLFLGCCLALLLGWRTSVVKWVVLIGQISYDHRNPMFFYGVDKILAALLLILCVAPIGRELSLDRVRAVRAAKRENLAARPPLIETEWTGACIRLMQIQMAVLFFYSAVAKAGDDWRGGDAVWTVFTTDEHFNPFILGIFAAHYWLVNLATYGTLLIEIAYPFLVWQRATRPFLLAGALFLHAQFALLMGLFYFSFVMMTGHMAFVRPEWLARLGAWWKRRIGAMEMIYDGRCGFCVRSMAAFLAFDGLNQISVRDFRRDPSPVVADAQLEKALFLVLPDGRALPGFEAYRHVVLRVPGLWWQVPFFYVPVLSRLVGVPLYGWIAANRGKLSALLRAPRSLSRLAPLVALALLLAAPHDARAAIKKIPYPEVPVVSAAPVQPDPSFAAFWKTFVQTVARRDSAALFALVAPSFVWTAQGALTAEFDPGRDAVHNFKVVFGFRQHGRDVDGGVANGPYWDALAQLTVEAAFYSASDKVGLICGPLLAEAADAAALERAQQTLAIDDDSGTWVFTAGDVPVVKAPGDTGAPLARLGKVALPVTGTYPPASGATPSHYEVLLPSGATGWIAASDAQPLVSDRLCYARTRDGAWSIAVFDQGEDEN
jgi:predicted DCC family thiol-disulfide oxidoreductase YuxK